MGIARRAFGTVGRQAAFVGVEGIGAWALNERVHRFTPMGDGHTVLLDHGLFSGAHHVKGLAEGLLRKNFNVVVMPGTFNTSFGTEKIVAHRVREIKKAYDKTGPVSLGGESAGGINWMLAAHEVPHMVRTINLFGTPIELDAEGPVLEGLLWVYGKLNPGQNLRHPETRRRVLTSPEGVHRTCIIPTHDVLLPRAAMSGGSDPMTEDVFVLATHFGVNGAFTKTVMFNSFAQTPETRKPFDADMYNRVIFPAFRTQPGAGR